MTDRTIERDAKYAKAVDDSQRAMIGARAKGVYEAMAKERQKRKPKSVPANLPEQKKADARDQAAAVNVHHGGYFKVGTIVHRGARPPWVDAASEIDIPSRLGTMGLVSIPLAGRSNPTQGQFDASYIRP